MPAFSKKVYIKDESFDPIYKTVNKDFYFRSKLIPVLFVIAGFLILGTQVIMPLLMFTTNSKTTPEMDATVLGVATGFNEFEFKELVPTKYYDETSMRGINTPEYFYITIPKLGIENAIVETNSLELSPKDKLGHYKGSALPGESGNAFIYGHSVLPLFYNPKNYKTIFSTLDKLETGDEIIVTYNNVDIVYKVEYSETEKPENINPLADYKPKYLNESTLTLMTCWPAGAKSKRLMVRAVIAE